ncbi:aggregation-promoting factor C-terminal-like domain-containing protein [Streptomyces erythrochromogenes]|uniref:aggregation-promoting factor C-terminal-like domain-containing protein n=1 Tax=Streptomyces erythrochromogenes TaxID=285574 RepID=UPI00368F3554
MNRGSVRGLAVVSATAVTAVGAVTGVVADSGDRPGTAAAIASDTMLLAGIPEGQQTQVQAALLTQQAETQAVAANTSARRAAEETARKQAAADAAAKQKAAEEAKKRKEDKETASRSAARGASPLQVQSSYTVAQVQALARQIVGADQFQCFSNIVERESTWNYRAANPSGAYGLVQAYPGSKMSTVAADWRTNPATQIKWGVNYMNKRYGSPCEAWSYWQAHHSY